MSPTMRWIKLLDGSEKPNRQLIGGKAHSIAHIQSLGLRVPPAFVVTTEAHAAYLTSGAFPHGLLQELADGIAWLERLTRRSFGTGPQPLLVSVRSGAAISMPGMMDTVLNVGITNQTELALATESGDTAFARDTHRRFAQLYGNVVLKADVDGFDNGQGADHWREEIRKATGSELPNDANGQLLGAVGAVFESWNSRRAKRYRQHQGISDLLGTAVTVQAMVFGNLDAKSGTGVLFSRNPSTGDADPFGEYLRRAQGEDVVSGAFTPEPLSAMADAAPAAYTELLAAARTLEHAEKEVQDIEFTVERGELFLLQTRNAKLAPQAAVRTAISMAREGLIDIKTAICRIPPDRIRQLMAPRIAPEARAAAVQLAGGDGACPGVGIGIVVTDADEAERLSDQGVAVVLARRTTSPHDLHGMISSTAVVTEEGGSTSHAAVVSRALGKPCIVGCGVDRLHALAGQTVTVDGQSGQIFLGSLAVLNPDEQSDGDLAQLTAWAEPLSPIRVIRAKDAPSDDILDLVELPGSEDAANLSSILAQHRSSKGAVGGAIASDEGVRVAIEAGLEFIVADPILPSLLAAVQNASVEKSVSDHEVAR